MVLMDQQQPSFFKVILPCPSASKQLRIPPGFVKHIEKYVPGRATLRGPSGSCWPVKLWKDRKGVHIKDGWHAFFKAHSLGDCEFLIFILYGVKCFDVRIYLKDGLEKVNVHLHHDDDSHNSMALEHDSGYEINNVRGEASNSKLCEVATTTIVKRKRGRPRERVDTSTFRCQDVEVKNEIIELSHDETDVELETEDKSHDSMSLKHGSMSLELSGDVTKSDSAEVYVTKPHHGTKTNRESRKGGYGIKNVRGEASNSKSGEAAMPTIVKRTRGRPRNAMPTIVKRTRGRPRKGKGVQERVWIVLAKVKKEIIELSDDETDV